MGQSFLLSQVAWVASPSSLQRGRKTFLLHAALGSPLLQAGWAELSTPSLPHGQSFTCPRSFNSTEPLVPSFTASHFSSRHGFCKDPMDG